MGTFKKLQQEFQEAFKDLDFGHGMTWTDEGVTGDGRAYFGWQDPYAAVFFDNYYIFVYLQKTGKMLISWARGDKDEEQGAELLEDGEYEQAKDFILNYFDNTEREED